MRALAISVTDGSPTSGRSVAALISSLGRQDAEVDLVLVLRGGATPPEPLPPVVRVHGVPAPLATSLSAARNLGLEHADQTGLLGRADIVSFPDDDCGYPPGLLPRVVTVLREGAGVVCGPYGPSAAELDRHRFPSAPDDLVPRLAMRVVSSGGLFFSPAVVRDVGRFDERFGLGARFGAAEDGDYVLRALELGHRAVYAPDRVFVEHPYKAHRPNEYYVGNVAVLAKHVRSRPTTVLLLVRRLAHGLVLAGRGSIDRRDLVSAVRTAMQLVISR